MTLAPRSMLFVSGEKAERFSKAFASGADLVCIDLEDAVQPAQKAATRARVLEWLAASDNLDRAAASAVRLNGLRTPEGLRDALALVESEVSVDWLLLPKVESAADIECIAGWAPDSFRGLTALIETPVGVENALAIASAIRSLLPGRAGALMLGGVDLSMELGATFGWEALYLARLRLVNAARAAGLQAWDVPFLGLEDHEGLLDETRRVIGLGFSCKAAIHPKQLAAVHEAFEPAPELLEWARDVLAAEAEAAAGAFIFQGKLVDAPVIKRAERLIELAELASRR
jgi:citrate lyase beta subunit